MKVLRPIRLVSRFFLMTLPLITMLASFFPNIVCGQVGTNGTKTWLDRDQNIKIIFSMTPAQPTIATSSVLGFAVQNLQTREPVTNVLATVVIFGGASNQETTFRLTNITAPDGRFSINVIFPAIGSYQVTTRITSQTHDVSSLASFTVIVPALQSASNLFGGNYIIWISLLIAIAIGAVSFLVLKNTIKADKSQRT
jgi:hypothetical protein